MSKKNWKRIIGSLLMVACVACLLAGCKKEKESAIVGVWELETMTMEGTTINLKDAAAAADGTGLDVESMKITMTAEKGGKLLLVAADETTESTWEEKDGKFTLDMQDGTFADANIADGKLSMESEGMQMVFVKAAK